MNFHNELKLKSKKSKYIKSLFSALIFVMFGLKLIMQTGSIAGWLITVIFGFAAIASLIPLLPNQSYLKIDKNGFMVRSMFQNIKILWNEVESFDTAKKNFRDTVIYSFKERKNFIQFIL